MTRNLIHPEVAEANRDGTRPDGGYTFNAFPPVDHEGVVFTLAVLRLGDHAHVVVETGNTIPDPTSQGAFPRATRGLAGHIILRWHEWEVLRPILDAQDCFRIAEVERPTKRQLEIHLPERAAA